MYLLQLSGMNKSENIQYFCKLMFEIANVPIRFIQIDGAGSFEFGCPQFKNPAASDSDLFLRQLQKQDKLDTFPVFTTTRYMEIFFSISLVKEASLLGTIIAGPVIPEEISVEAINTLFKDFEISVKNKMELVGYYQSLPVVSYQKLISAALLLFFLVYGKKLDSADVIERNAHLQLAYEKMEETIDKELARNRQHSVYHHKIEYERELLKYVREGNKDKLLEHLNKSTEGQSGKLSKNPLRNQKNLFICSTSLVTRAAIEGGLSSELAMTVSDTYIQRMEGLNEISGIMNLYYQMLCDFTERVHKIKELHYSKAVMQCLDYISRYLHDAITISHLAEATGISRNYLSELFKKEVGISLREHILNAKVEEAKGLLAFSGESIMDICTCLNFSDQSYFTKVFRKYAGVTPGQYRNRLGHNG